ncbi:TetR family transcriptional regulator [Corynebacterium callunae]|uniref:TetR/AcrR family transcriptional regulator n=1 Tax=Corynebacterium callunae TaxID=1721 RepID=UPI003981EC2D
MPDSKGHGRSSSRRDEIIDACLDVICEFGVANTTHRKVAEVAGVALGSITYHFKDLNELIVTAFERFVADNIRWCEENFAGVDSFESATAALLRVFSVSDHTIILSAELYARALHSPEVAAVFSHWLAEYNRIYSTYFDDATSRMIDALWLGLVLNRNSSTHEHPEILTAQALERIVLPTSYIESQQ